MYQARHTGPPTNPQPPNQAQFNGPMQVINESCDRIKKEFDALQAANHNLRLDNEKLHSDKNELNKRFIMYYEMSYGLHLDVCKQKEIVKRLNGIIINVLPFISSDQQAQVATALDRAKQVSSEELNSIVDQQYREGYANEMHPGMALHNLIGPLSGTPGLPGVPGMPPQGPPLHLPPNLPPHTLPPHGPPMPLPPQSLMQPGLNMSSPPNTAGLLAMSGAPNLPGLGAGGLLAGMPGPLMPSHPIMPKDNPPTSRNNLNNNNMLMDNNSLNNSNSTFNHNKPSRNSIDNERRAASRSSATSDRDHRDGIGGVSSHLNDSKHQHPSKKSRRSDDIPHSQHQVMLNNSSSVSDDEKSEDLIVDGNDDRAGSPSSHHNGSNSPRENGSSIDWNSKGFKKERPLSRASSVTSGCGPSNRERSSPKTGNSNKAKSSPNPLGSNVAESLGPLGPGMHNHLMPSFSGGFLPPDIVLVPQGVQGHLAPGGVVLPFGSIPEPYSLQRDHEGRFKPIPCSLRALADPGLPKSVRERISLVHGEVVCAVALSNPTRNIYTGGKGFVKVWSLDNSESNSPTVIHEPIAQIPCLSPENYVRSCKLLPGGKKLVVGGETPPITVWDLANGGPKQIGQLQELATACYALAISPDSKICISCFSDGTVGLYDIHNLQLIGKFQGHEDGASCADISSDGNSFFTGGLDYYLKSWNLNSNKILGENDYVTKTKFGSQIFSLGCCPSGDYTAVGMEDSIVEVMNIHKKHEKMQLKMHDSCVLALKFATSGKWFMTTGKDRLLNICGSPAINCPLLMKVSNELNLAIVSRCELFLIINYVPLQLQESSSVLSCDISGDDKYFATGSGDKKATVYEVIY